MYAGLTPEQSRDKRMENGAERKGVKMKGTKTNRDRPANQTDRKRAGNHGAGVRRGEGLTEGECQLNTSQLLFCFKDRQ